jgi:hypothetical protein
VSGYVPSPDVRSAYGRDDLVAIASDKFGTHVLCRAIAIKELEVGGSANVPVQQTDGAGTYFACFAETRGF